MGVHPLPAARPPHTRRWVRVTQERADGFIEFDFAIGDPELSVELILPRTAFEEFCRHNQAQVLPPAPPRGDTAP